MRVGEELWGVVDETDQQARSRKWECRKGVSMSFRTLVVTSSEQNTHNGDRFFGNRGLIEWREWDLRKVKKVWDQNVDGIRKGRCKVQGVKH